MFIWLLECYSPTPTPSYAFLATELRTMGHTVWHSRLTSSGDLLWSDGRETVAKIPEFRNAGHHLSRHSQATVSASGMHRLRELIATAKPDIVQVNIFPGCWRLSHLRKLNACVVLDVRQAGVSTGWGWRDRIRDEKRRLLLRLIGRTCFDRVTFLNEACAAWALGNRWERWAHVVPLGVPETYLTCSGPPVASETEQPLFIYLGTIAKTRELGRLLEAMQWLQEHGHVARLLFLGPDQAGGHYREQAARLRISGRVEFASAPTDRISDLVQQADVGLAYVPLSPTYARQPSLKALEYRALGLPIIGTDYPSNRDVVKHGVNGLLVANSSGEIAAAMQQFIVDKPWAARAAANAASMRSGLSWGQVAEMYVQVYSNRWN